MNSYEHTSREFLPLSVIRSACAGDTDAVEQVLQHYRGYINKLCTGILYDKHGQPHVCIDEYMKRHLEIKLISSIVTKAETGLTLSTFRDSTLKNMPAGQWWCIIGQTDTLLSVSSRTAGAPRCFSLKSGAIIHHAAMQARLLAGHDIQAG